MVKSSDHDAASPLQGYFDWQTTTLMLAYDLHDPVSATNPEDGEKRRRAVEDEVRQMTLALIPDIYKDDPTLSWPPEVMMDITRATILRASQVAGVIGA
jgi:hypothetical protein